MKAAEARKIVFVTDTLGRGGSERQLALLADRIRDFGFSVTVAVLYQDGPWGDFLRGKGIAVTAMGFRAPPNVNRRMLVPFIRFCRWLRKERPEVVISFLYRPSVWSALAAFVARVPVVISRRADCGFVRRQSPFPAFIEKIAVRNTRAYVAVVQCVAESIADEGVPKNKITVIHNGIDLPASWSFPTENPPAIGILANLSKIKDHLTLVRAMGKVVRKYPQARCEMAGIDSGCGGEIQNEIQQLHLEKNIILLGPLSDTDAFMKRIGVGVLCSKSEGLSNSILEYMTHGRAVVASRAGGNAELVDHEKTGFLFSVGNADELARYLILLLGDRVMREEMGESGRERIKQSFTAEQTVLEWKKLIDRVSYGE